MLCAKQRRQEGACDEHGPVPHAVAQPTGHEGREGSGDSGHGQQDPGLTGSLLRGADDLLDEEREDRHDKRHAQVHREEHTEEAQDHG